MNKRRKDELPGCRVLGDRDEETKPNMQQQLTVRFAFMRVQIMVEAEFVGE